MKKEKKPLKKERVEMNGLRNYKEVENDDELLL